MQLLELGIQTRERLSSPGEGFMWDDAKHKRLSNTAIETADRIIKLIGGHILVRDKNVYVHAICTWKTDARAERLSSCIASTEHIVGEPDPMPKWTNTVPYALHPDADTVDEIFDHSFSIEQEDDPDGIFFSLIPTHASKCQKHGGVLVVDSQNFIYGDLVEPQRIIHRHGFTLEESFLGGEIIVV